MAINKEIVLDPSVIPPLDESLLTLTDQEKAFLHSAITEDDTELRRRILEVQKLAYAKHAYPCIRAFHFVNLMMSANPVYPKVLEAGRTGQTIFLDLGCCMGTDVRKLVADGYPARNVIGCDLRQEFIDLGYELYKDKNTSQIHFLTSDIFDVPVSSPSEPEAIDLDKVIKLTQLTGQIDYFYAGALFHLFDESTQYELAKRVATLVKRKPGTIIFGRHQGLEEAGYIDDHLGRDRYGHSPVSWPILWKQVFTELESPEFAEKIVVDAFLNEGFAKHVVNTRQRARMLVWSVRIT
ncbi:hypothetical protein K474DRAFT_1713069 [Panus rudis PR-1116 ss-1]|nr:hypothetical protein K474DRAFT_1713069 [Panus rudis PR-1116 ss-1]